jgi:F420-non-reducing hydrogenase iron-sulfur subunit
MILSAFEKGAEGVMVLGCEDKACRYGPGPAQAEKTARTIEALIHTLGLEPERFALLQYTNEDQEKLAEDVEAFFQCLDSLGKSPFSPHKEETAVGGRVVSK